MSMAVSCVISNSFLYCTQLTRLDTQTLSMPQDEDILSDVVPSNIVSRQVRLYALRAPLNVCDTL